MTSRKHRQRMDRAPLEDLPTTISKETLAELASGYLTSLRPYLDRTRELEEKADTGEEVEESSADHAPLWHNEQVEHWSDAATDVFSMGTDSDRHYLLYELLRRSGDPYAEAWVLTNWEDGIRPPLPPALRDLICQAIDRTPILTPVAIELGWLT
jgi:hypothetical protein